MKQPLADTYHRKRRGGDDNAIGVCQGSQDSVRSNPELNDGKGRNLGRRSENAEAAFVLPNSKGETVTRPRSLRAEMDRGWKTGMHIAIVAPGIRTPLAQIIPFLPRPQTPNQAS
jgi:hypothetical protein